MAKFHKEHNGLVVKRDDILIASGYTVLLAFEKADVFIPAPTWVSYAPQTKLADQNVIKLNTNYQDKWRVKPETIKV
jgi:aspartate/methionine/tyrosine aminotransferase